MKKTILMLVIGAVALFLLIQIVPYGRNHTNPAVVQEPNWDSPQTRILAQRACFDCHSDETTWPWYSNIAPISWLVQRDVIDGRRRLNLSEWRGRLRELGEMSEVVRGGRMPPSYYVLLHPQAKLSSQEQDQLIQGLTNTFRSTTASN